MGWIMPALAGASALAGAFQRTPRPDVRGTYNYWSNLRPTGWLTGEDYKEAARQEGGRNAAIGANYSNARAGAITRAARGGYASSPALDATLTKLDTGQGGALERSGEATQSGLYRTMMGRERFADNMAMQGFGADIAGQRMQYNRAQAQKGAFWNSVNQYMPFMMDYFGKGKVNAASGFGQGEDARMASEPSMSAWTPTNAGGEMELGYGNDTGVSP